MSQTAVFERATRFLSALRHCQVLGLQLHDIDDRGVTLILPYSEKIIGDPENGLIHGGALSSLMDTACVSCPNSKSARPSTCASTTCTRPSPARTSMVMPNATG